MNIFLSIVILLTVGISFAFTIIAFYTDSKGIPYLYSGGYFYIIGSFALLIISILTRNKEINKLFKYLLNSLYLIHIVLALIFSLICLYSMPFGYANNLANIMFTLSLLITSIAIIITNKRTETNKYIIFLWILFIFCILSIGAIISLIQMYNSPNGISYQDFSFIVYFSTVLVLLFYVRLIAVKFNKILKYLIFGISLTFFWIGIKLFIPIIVNTLK